MKYIESKIDGKQYCVSNGEFSRHLAMHGLSRRDYFVEHIGDIKYCVICGDECRFNDSGWVFFETCGKRSCSGKQRWSQYSEDERKKISLKKSARWESRDKNEKKAISEKRKNTCQQKYGVEHPMFLDVIKQKVVDTNIEKYGNKTPLLNNAVKEKIRNTMIEHYGVEHPMNSDVIKQRLQETNVERYGVRCTLMDDTVKEKILKTNIGRYGNPIPQCSEIVRERISGSNKEAWKNNGDDILGKCRTTNIERYGVDNPSKMETFRKKVKRTLIENRDAYEKTILTEDEIAILNDKDVVGKMYEDGGIHCICEKFSIGESTAYRYLRKSGYQKARSSFEAEVVSYIREIYDGNVVCNNRKLVSGFELDIFLPEKMVAFECNGTFWHSEEAGKEKYYHFDKSKAFANVGVKVFHIWEHQWIKNKEVVKSWIRHLLGRSEGISARKCELKVLSFLDAKHFLDNNHRQGSCASSLNISLTYNGEIVALMTFGKPRYNKKYQYELLRFASKNGSHVIGGASKMFSWFVKNYSPKSVISYSDRMMNDGGVYVVLGMKHVGDSEPCFFYTRNYRDVYHRSVFQKHKLKTMLEHFDETLTARENMANNGYGRIWDCGTSVYLKTFEDEKDV